MDEFDAIVVGAGPAGATAAINLAPFRRVLLVDRRAEPADRIGDSLAPAARRLLNDMGLWADFANDGHSPWYVARSTWGDNSPTERDSIADLDGNGWHIDRKQFEIRLRKAAVARGAVLLAPARPIAVSRSGAGWRVTLEHSSRPKNVSARLILDCGGRASCLLKPFGASRRAHDRLLCAYVFGVRGASSKSNGSTYVESAADGWWYTSASADGRRVLAWHSDADLMPATLLRSRSDFLERARLSRRLSAEIADASFDGVDSPRVIAAYSSVLTPPAGEGWIAAGDAALSFDPISSQGLFHALYTGLASAAAAERIFLGDNSGLSDYAARLTSINAAYARNLKSWYALESRWRDHAFWQRRQN
jgi:flavin-dependent dehydrogenase